MGQFLRICAVATAVTSLALAGCKEDITITFDNQTTIDLLAEISDGGFVEITAGSSKAVTHRPLPEEGDVIEITVVREDNGRIVYHDRLTRDELGEMDDTVVIEAAVP
ncbi:MAG: hypothetical protein U1B78_02135 [Dehalococcoidia bacterium]|nr:hypothetical protein [Dehalococcoidia bacterium]